MANQKHLEVLMQSVSKWHQWRNENPQVKPDLSEANLQGVTLIKAYLSGSNLRAANLKEANLCESILTDTDLQSANAQSAKLNHAKLQRANLHRTDFTGAHLIGANLCDAKLIGTNFSGAYFNMANLSGAEVRGAVFGDTDLSLVKGLNTLQHRGPSTIGIDTIYKSGGKISESFLRCCGVPDNFIANIESSAVQATNFFSCFISYDSKDEEFAKRLHSQLSEARIRAWLTPGSINGIGYPGDGPNSLLQHQDRLLIVLSEHSLQSDWIATELCGVPKIKINQRQRNLFPVRLVNMKTIGNWKCFDADNGKDLAATVREYYIPDFSSWRNHNDFKAAFAKLLEELCATALTS
jgi:Pentapeptide repeats (8 copies)/TIR domain